MVLGMEFNVLLNMVCGELPPGSEMTINLESGCASVTLYTDGDATIDGDDLCDETIETQIIELVKVAKEEPSKFDI